MSFYRGVSTPQKQHNHAYSHRAHQQSFGLSRATRGTYGDLKIPEIHDSRIPAHHDHPPPELCLTLPLCDGPLRRMEVELTNVNCDFLRVKGKRNSNPWWDRCPFCKLAKVSVLSHTTTQNKSRNFCMCEETNHHTCPPGWQGTSRY